MKVRNRVWDIIETAQPQDTLSLAFDIFIITLILLNILAVIIGSINTVAQQFEFWLSGFEVFSVMIFTAEYLFRLWSCVSDPRYRQPFIGRLKFMLRPLVLMDLLAILPFYLLFLDADARFLRLFRILRLLRLAKLYRYSTSLKILSQVLKAKKEELILTGVLIVIILIVASSLVYFFEHPVQPQAFPNIPATMWWGIVTLSTIGYGDVFPITAAGRLITSFIAILGIGMFALPAGILGAGFIEIIQNNQANQCQKKVYCPYCGHRLE
ncbi:MAG: potassium channel family protein [Pseudomonadota bacterium]|nr:potassium channel family protein [Pseudomonadota bacterium]